MTQPGFERIFISYARKDAAELALRLQKDLKTAGFDVWLDKQRIEGARTRSTACATPCSPTNRGRASR